MTLSLPSLSYGTVQHVEAELVNYHRTLLAIEQRSRDIIESRGRQDEDAPVGRRSAGAWADPTLYKVTALAADAQLREMTRIAGAIRGVHEDLTEEPRRLLELWYWEKRSADDCAELLCVDRATVYRWRKGIVAAVAARLGWQ